MARVKMGSSDIFIPCHGAYSPPNGSSSEPPGGYQQTNSGASSVLNRSRQLTMNRGVGTRSKVGGSGTLTGPEYKPPQTSTGLHVAEEQQFSNSRGQGYLHYLQRGSLVHSWLLMPLSLFRSFDILTAISRVGMKESGILLL